MKKSILFSLLFILSAGHLLAQRPIKLKNEADSISYALGFMAGNSIYESYPGIGAILIPETFQYAFKATLAGEMPFMDEDKAESFVDEYFEALKERLWRENRVGGEHFLTENRNKPDVYVTSSGLQYKVIRAGDDENECPREYDDMVISYVGKTIDGTVFEKEEKTSTFPGSLNGGLNEGTQLMSPGARYVFYLPSKLAYGENAHGNLPPYSAVVYEVEMISMTRDHDYYSERDGEEESENDWSDDEEMESRQAGDYQATAIPPAGLHVSVDGYDSDEIVKTYEVEGFRVVMTGDKTIVLDRQGREVFRDTLDEESNSYDRYYLTEFRHRNGEGPLFLILDMGFDYGSFFGSMVYKVENGVFSQVPGFLNLVKFNRGEDETQYGRLTPVLDLSGNGRETTFFFQTPTLSYNPAGSEVIVPGEDFQYVYREGKLEETGAALNLSYFTTRVLTDQFQQVYDYGIWHAEKGDVDGDGQQELVVFVRENETIYVCQLDDAKLGEITGFDLPYDYSIDRSSRVLRNNVITLSRDDNDMVKHLVVYNGNLVEKE